MAELNEIEARLRVLEDLEAIRGLRHKYFRCLDGRLWDEMVDCFTEDVKASYFNGEYLVDGRDNLIQFFQMGITENKLALHHGHTPEIELTGDRSAKGYWVLYNYFIDMETGTGQRVGGIYFDEYVKENGRWRISSITCNQLFQETWENKDIPSLTYNLRGTPQYAATYGEQSATG